MTVRASVFLKDKKGAAMIYTIMVLLLLTTVIVALTALSTASYNDAVLTVSDDQSYYYAKSLGLAVKEQFKDGYSIGKVIDALDQQEQKYIDAKKVGSYFDPIIKGTFNVSKDDGQLVNGTVQVRYARNSDDSANKNVIEVRTACVVNNSPAVVTSIYSCEKDTGEEADHLSETLTDYDVVLTTGKDLDFDFTQAADSSGTSSVNVYVYTDEDEGSNPNGNTFNLYYNMYGKLTTTGKTTIASKLSKANKTTAAFRTISGNLTSYGDVTLNYTGVLGAYGLHADGNVELQAYSFVTNDIYAHGTVTIKDPEMNLHYGYLQASAGFNGFYEYTMGAWHSARNVCATGAVTIGARAWLTGSVYSQGDVSISGKGAVPGSSGYEQHFGNTYIAGSVYAQGNVTIRNGAVVRGDVIAGGSVVIEKGAFVCGNVSSVNAGVNVLGAGVGGQVNAKTYLWVQNHQSRQGSIPEDDFSAYALYLREFDFSGVGTILYGGIGLFKPAGVTYKHTCKYFGTDNGEYVSIVRGNLYVSDAIEQDYTPFLSVWCTDSVYLEKSRARFRDIPARTHVGISPYSSAHLSGVTIHPYTYVYTYIHELNQKADFIETIGGNQYLEMYGARIDTLNLGTSMSDLYDGYLWKGWVGNINARCLLLADMHLDGYIYCAQYCEPWGTGTNWVAYESPNYAAYSFAGGYTQQNQGTTIEVACRNPGYQGKNTSESRIGFWLAKYCILWGLVNVGSDVADGWNSDAYVILGDERAGGTSYLVGGMNAYVADFTITKTMRLSDSSDPAVAASWSAVILAEIFDGGGNQNYVNSSQRPAAAANSFYVAPSSGAGVYRVHSIIQVKGDAYIAGVVGHFQHFLRDDGSGTFINTSAARVKGTFVSTGQTLSLVGTDVFNEVYVTNSSSVTTLTGSFKTNNLRVNGKLNINKKSLTVNGDAFIGMLASNDMYNTVVSGNLTIGSINDSATATLTASSKLTVTKDLYLGKGNIALSSNSHNISGTVQTGNGNLTISGSATVKHAHVNGWLNMQGGALEGDFLAVYMNVTGGLVGVYGEEIDATVGYYIHSGGKIQRLHVNCVVDASDSVQISGTAVGEYVFIDTLGGARVTGGAGVDYQKGGLMSEKGNVVICGGFQCGVSANNGNLTIGSDNDGSEYKVGYSNNYNESDPSYRSSDGYSFLYASGYINWNGKYARGAFTESPKYAGATILSALNYIKVGSEQYPVKGFFSGFFSKNSSVEAYVGSVISVSAKTTAKVYVMGISEKGTAGFIGNSSRGDAESYAGINAGGDIHVKWLSHDRGVKSKTGLIQGHFETKGNFYFDGTMDAIARISCKDIYNLDKVVKHDGALYLSLYLFNPTGSGSIKKDSDGYFEIKDSFAVHEAGLSASKLVGVKWVSYKYTDTGSFSINGNLKFAYPVRVEGQLYVNGILKYKGEGASTYSETDLPCLGGLYCLNTTVNLPADAKGDVELPNVTSVSLNGDIGLNAEHVETIELKNNAVIGRSLKLTGCKSFTLSAGCEIKGSLWIADDGRVVNNGKIGEKVSCGVYEGSGTVGMDLIVNQKDKTSKITGSGYVTGNIWTAGSLNINSTGTFGSKNSYIYAAQDIDITNAKFYNKSDSDQMDYILSTGGHIELTNCADFIPKVWNTKGYIRFKNKGESKRALIKSVLSYGTYIDFGSSDDGSNGDDYQTVTGAVHWEGNYSGNAVDFRNGTHTVVQGALKAVGNGNVMLRNATIGAANFNNAGTVTADSGGTLSGLYVNSSSSKRVTSVSISAKIKGNIVMYGDNATTTFTLNGAISDNAKFHVFGGKSLTVDATVSSTGLSIRNVKESTFKQNITANFEVTGGKTTVDGDISGNLRTYSANVYINGNIGGSVTATSPNIYGKAQFYTVALGNQKKTITVGGNISVHGRLADNSKQTKAASQIFVSGTYYADIKKDFTNLGKLNYTTEGGGQCVIVGRADGARTIDAEINVAGRLCVYSVWKEDGDQWLTTTFNRVVKCNALVVNAKPAEAMDDDSKGDDEIYLSDVPIRKVIRYTKSENTSKAWGVDKHAWMEDLRDNGSRECPATWADIYYDAREDSTKQDLVVFNKPVYVTFSDNSDDKYREVSASASYTVYWGTVHACNTKWAAGSTLYSDGQVSMSYCCLYSKGYAGKEKNQKHCIVPAQGGYAYSFWDTTRSTLDMDGSMFVHAYDAKGDNYFGNVTTNSNLSIYNGNNYVKSNSEFKGCTAATDKGYNGSYNTVLMFFGASLFLDGGARIKTARDRDVNYPAGRTIVWVNSGTLYVGSDSYIGYEKYGRSTKDDDLDTNINSFHPGVFVSDTNGGSISYGGVSYEKGTACVKGSVSLDICAYRNIRIYKNGVVTAKAYNDKSEKKYKAGLYVSKGGVLLERSDGTWTPAKESTSNPGSPGGWFGYFDATSGRDFYTSNDGSGVSDPTAYVPYGDGYAAKVRDGQKGWPSYSATNLWVYTPLWDAPPQIHVLYAYRADNLPKGIASDTGSGSFYKNLTRSLSSITDNNTFQIDGKPSAPAKPTIDASGTLFGDASVSPVGVHNTGEYLEGKDRFCNDTVNYNPEPNPLVYHTVYGANWAEAAPTGYDYVGGRANEVTLWWTNPSYNTTDVVIKHPSLYWTASITNNFDTTVKAYWNTRYIPYVWKLPYDDAYGATPAKRLLKVRSFDRGGSSGDFDLTEWDAASMVGDAYFVTKDHYSGSNLSKRANDVVNWRKESMSGDALWDVICVNASGGDHKRRCKMLVFESGELPYDAFMMGDGHYSEDRTGNLLNKQICGTNQEGWWMGDDDASNYDVTWIFYACANPADPYGSAAKDLHVVLPQGIATRFYVDGNSQVTVLGNGRVFLYLTSGDTIWFKGKAVNKKTSGWFIWKDTTYSEVYTQPVGGLKKVNDSRYEPQLYIIGAGTDIDLIIEDFPVSAVIYMPFGHSTKLYSATSGSLKRYNQFYSMVDNRNFSKVNGKTWYSPSDSSKQTVAVRPNSVTFKWSNSIGLPKWLYGQVIVDQFFYSAENNVSNLSFKNELIKPNLGNTTIYSYSTKSDSMRGGKTYTLDTFLVNAPSYSTKLLYWDYVGMKVEV